MKESKNKGNISKKYIQRQAQTCWLVYRKGDKLKKIDYGKFSRSVKLPLCGSEAKHNQPENR